MARTCFMCNQRFVAKRSDQHMCSSRCRAQFDNLAAKRARRLYLALYHWRTSRDDSRDLQFIAHEIAHWKAEDKIAGRGVPPRHDHDRVESKWRPQPKGRAFVAQSVVSIEVDS